MRALPIGVLASGTGTNFEAIAEAIVSGTLDAEIRLLLCNRPHASVLERAREKGVTAEVVDHEGFEDRERFDRELVSRLCAVGTELVVLAGFDRLITAAMLEAFPQRIINIHPALLPAFKGVDAQAQATDHGVRIAGATVHIVDERVDHGPIIIQAAVPVVPGESEETVRRRILRQEHKIYPRAIQLFAEGRVRVSGRRVIIAGVGEPTGEVLISPPLEN